MKRVLAIALGGALASLALPARAGEEPDRAPPWSPGERTTSSLAGEVRGDDSPARGDGVYGRLGGRFDLGAALGAEVREGGVSPGVLASLHYYSMAGVYAGYSDALGAERATARLACFGVDLRPAFIPRWSKAWERGPAFLDLAVDSISLGLGAYFREPRGESLGDARGLEVSLGFGLPLAGTAAGPWLRTRGLLRWDEPGGRARAAALVALGWDFVM